MKLAPAAVLLAALSAPQLVAAADVPANSTTKAVLPISQTNLGAEWKSTSITFEKPGDIDWYKMSVVQNHSYVVSNGNGNDDYADMKVVDRNKRTLTKPMFCTGRACTIDFVASYTGTVYLVAGDKYDGGYQGADTQYNTYFFRATDDCAATLVTTCRGTINQPRHGYWDWSSDHDFYRFDLLKARTYVISLSNNNCGTSLRIIDRNGKVVVRPTYAFDNLDAPRQQSYYFIAGYTGPYFVDFSPTSDNAYGCNGDYSFTVEKRF